MHTCTDIDYADDVTLLVDTQDKYPIALSAMDEEASKFGLHVSWSKTKIQNLGCGPTPFPVVVNGNTVEPVQDFTYLGSIQTSNRNSSSECTRRIGHAGGVMKRLDHFWNQPNLTMPTKGLNLAWGRVVWAIARKNPPKGLTCRCVEEKRYMATKFFGVFFYLPFSR